MAADNSKPWEDFSPVVKPSSSEQPDTKPWEDFGGETKPAPKGFMGHARDLGLSVLQGAIGVPEAAVGLADIPTGGAVGKAMENEGGAFGFRPKQAREYLDTLKTDGTQQQKREFEQADGVIGKTAYALQNPSLVANAVAESLPMMGAGGVIGRGIVAAAPKVGAGMAAAAGEGITAAGSAAEQIRQETADGTLTPTQAGLAAAAGAATAGFGALGAKVAGRLGIADADTLMVQGAKGLTGEVAKQAAMKSIPRKVIEGAISEGFLEELPQSASEQILQNFALGKDWSEGVDSAVVLGVLSGMAMGGGAAGVQGVMQSPRQEAAPGQGADGSASPAETAKPLVLPAPTYTGTPEEQLRQAEAARAGDVAAADARAAELYQQRADFEASQKPARPGLEMMRQAYAEQLQALQGQEAGEPDVPQSAPPDGRSILNARRNAEIAAGRAMTSPDDEILQSIGAAEPPHQAMGIDPEAGPLSTGAAIAVDSGAHWAMTAPSAGARLLEGAAPAALVSTAADTPAARWDSLTTQERADVAARAGLPPVIASNIPRAGWENLNGDLQARISTAMAPTAKPATSAGPGASLGDGWAAFPPESGTLAVPRAQMPQIKAEHRGAMTNFMNARGVSHTTGEVPADSLRPTQAEFSPEKVRKAASFEGGDRSILVSSDNYVLDGHHQRLAKREAGEPVKVIRLNAPIQQLIGLAHEFPSSTTADGASAQNGLGDRGRAAAVADDLRAMAQDAGWAERGGMLIRDGAGNATGRTKWLPRAEWFMAGMEADPATLARDIDRFVGGEKVPAKSRRTIDGMLDWLDVQRGESRLDEDASAYDFEAAGIGQDASEDALLIGEIFTEAAPQEDAAVMRALGFTEEEIQDVVGQKADREGPRGTGQDGAGRAQEAGEVARGDAQAQGEARSEGAPEGLTSYTNEDIARQEAAQRAAAAEAERTQREAEQKAQADAERDTFTLTGSDRPADVLAAKGHGLFDAPAEAKPTNLKDGLAKIRKEKAAQAAAEPNQEPIKNEPRANAGPAVETAPADQEAVKNLSPGTRINGKVERAAADRLESLYAEMAVITNRNSREGNAKAAVRSVIEELRRERTVTSVVAVLEGASSALARNYGAFSDVLDQVAESLGGQPKAKSSTDQPVVGNAPSPLEALFSDLNSDSTRKANKARRASAKLPQAARIDYVQANFHDMLIQMMEAGVLEVNGATTLTEDNAPCL